MSAAQHAGVVPSTPAASASITPPQLLNNATSFTAGTSSRLSLPDTSTISNLPRQVAKLVGLENMATRILGRASNAGVAGNVMTAAQAAGEAAGEGMAETAESGLRIADIFHAMRRFSGFFSYITSRWSLACFSVALILNRITIYASTRRHLHLRWDRRLLLRIIPIILFLTQILSLLRAIRCQTSPDYSIIRYGKPGKRLIFEHAGGGGFLYSLGSTLLPWESDQQSCSAVNMGSPLNASDIPYGSFTLLWPVFIRLCLSHFVETVSCALQGRAVVTEAGMSIFEHSLAFAEAESMISHSIGLGLFGLTKNNGSDDLSMPTDGHSPLHTLTRNQVLERMNVSPELLLIAMISCCNSLTSNILDVFGKQSRYRLFNTAIWGLSFMAAIVWGLLDETAPLGGAAGPKFPTVCIVGFVPHLMILFGILTCIAIYTLALTVTAFSLPPGSPQPGSLRERFALAHENMQGANQIQNIRFSRHEDFYTTLLRIGYTSLTAASEAVFLNEGKGVVARQMTWLEEDRFAELEASRDRGSSYQHWDSHGRATAPETGDMAEFVIPEAPDEWESGYGREKKIEKVKTETRQARAQTDLTGIGMFRGASRCYHGYAFFRGIFSLIFRWSIHLLNRLLDGFGISARPQWLKTLAGPRKKGSRARNNGKHQPLDFWILSDNGELELPEDNEFDVEEEFRKRERSNKVRWGQPDEQRLDQKLYDWWKVGGSWGDQDQSADYKPSDADDLDDTTSVVSMSSNADSEWEEYESDGRRTPTQDEPFPASSSENGPIDGSLLDMTSISRLLDPRDRESRHEARILAAHLASERSGPILTRRRYQQQMEREKARILLSSRYSLCEDTPLSGCETRKPSPMEESEILERLILSRRSEQSSSNTNEQSWESGASGLGPNGPPCVICQTSPRSIITWPCRCLCVCEECRPSREGRRRALSPLERCLKHPPLLGERGSSTVDLETLELIKAGDGHNAQVVTVELLSSHSGREYSHLKGSKLVAEVYDPLYFDDDDGYINPFTCVDKHYIHEVHAYNVLSEFQGALIPMFYGSYSLDIHCEESAVRSVRLILIEYGPAPSMFQLDPKTHSQDVRKQIMKSVVDFESSVYQKDIGLTDLAPRNVLMVDADSDSKRHLVYLDFAGAIFGRRLDGPVPPNWELFLGQYISPLLRWDDCNMTMQFTDWIDWEWSSWIESEYAHTAAGITDKMRAKYCRYDHG